MEMTVTEWLQDKILVLCGIISENTKTITLRILYHLKLAPTHLLMPESGRADLLPSTPLIGTTTHLPWVTISSTTKFPHTTRKKRNWFLPATILYKHRCPPLHQTSIPSSWYPSPYLNSAPRSNFFCQTSLLVLLESLTGCYKLDTLNSNPCSYYSSMAYGNPTQNLRENIGWNRNRHASCIRHFGRKLLFWREKSWLRRELTYAP